ncbi:MAG: MerR family transcriptional regulator [Bacteroidales bacterium]|nr:MerR family transcriptional regulator [Bacteroidales bacterium]
MLLNNKNMKKIYYTIGEVADMFKVKTSLIRFWEKEFDVIKPQKNKKGNRLFTQEDINSFHLIFHLVKEQGHTLQGAKEKLKINKEQLERNIEIVKSLNKVKSFLNEIKANMD